MKSRLLLACFCLATICRFAASDGENKGVVDLTPLQDGGVLKEIKTEGSGDEHPVKGDEVFVHYVGKLTDGTVFDSSRDHGQEYTFILGIGRVIQCYEIFIPTMKKGELAVFTCKPQYAYGERGVPPTIPPDATLIFEVELIDFTDLQVVTVATEHTDGFERFLRSTKKYGLELEVLGMGKKWEGGDIAMYEGGGQKINFFKEAVEKWKDEKNLLVMFVDSYDLVFTAGSEEILKAFKKFDAKVVFSSEDFCWPDSSLADKYPAVKAKKKKVPTATLR